MTILRSAHLLRQFLAVAREGSLSAAANTLCVTQPALTKSIQRLEQELGVKLFERLPRGIALTKHGQVMLVHAQRIDAECNIADLELQAFGEGQTGRLRVGMGEFFSASLVPQAVAAMRESYPQLSFELSSAVTAVSYERLLAGELDILFGTLPQVDPLPEFLVVHLLMPLNSRVIAGAQHPLVAKAVVGPDELAAYPWAVLHHDREVIQRLLSVIGGAGRRSFDISVDLTSLSSLVQLLRSGPYLAVFVEGYVRTQPHLGLSIDPPPCRRLCDARRAAGGRHHALFEDRCKRPRRRSAKLSAQRKESPWPA